MDPTVDILSRAVRKGDEVTFYTVRTSIPPNGLTEDQFTGSTMLHDAITISGREQFIEPLIALGVPITLLNRKGYTALHIAIVYNRVDIVRTLCSSYDVNVLRDILQRRVRAGQTSLQVALSQSNPDMLDTTTM